MPQATQIFTIGGPRVSQRFDSTTPVNWAVLETQGARLPTINSHRFEFNPATIMQSDTIIGSGATFYRNAFAPSAAIINGALTSQRPQETFEIDFSAGRTVEIDSDGSPETFTLTGQEHFDAGMFVPRMQYGVSGGDIFETADGGPSPEVLILGSQFGDNAGTYVAAVNRDIDGRVFLGDIVNGFVSGYYVNADLTRYIALRLGGRNQDENGWFLLEGQLPDLLTTADFTGAVRVANARGAAFDTNDDPTNNLNYPNEASLLTGVMRGFAGTPRTTYTYIVTDTTRTIPIGTFRYEAVTGHTSQQNVDALGNDIVTNVNRFVSETWTYTPGSNFSGTISTAQTQADRFQISISVVGSGTAVDADVTITEQAGEQPVPADTLTLTLYRGVSSATGSTSSIEVAQQSNVAVDSDFIAHQVDTINALMDGIVTASAVDSDTLRVTFVGDSANHLEAAYATVRTSNAISITTTNTQDSGQFLGAVYEGDSRFASRRIVFNADTSRWTTLEGENVTGVLTTPTLTPQESDLTSSFSFANLLVDNFTPASETATPAVVQATILDIVATVNAATVFGTIPDWSANPGVSFVNTNQKMDLRYGLLLRPLTSLNGPRTVTSGQVYTGAQRKVGEETGAKPVATPMSRPSVAGRGVYTHPNQPRFGPQISDPRKFVPDN